MRPLQFKLESGERSGAPRAGLVETPHGSFNTPALAVVGTKATVKGVLPKELKAIGAEILLANTYHLFLQPGEAVVKDAGGLHAFMGWNGPLITDSGGFQVFSLGAGFEKGVSKFVGVKEGDASVPSVYDPDTATEHGKLAIVDDEGVSFTSHLDGTLYRFTPERSVEIQHDLGADIFFAFDECTSPHAPREYQKEAALRTERWAKRSLSAHRANIRAQSKQALFGIVQGGRYPDIRAENARAIAEMDFDGFGIGGSFSKEDLGIALEAAIEPLPDNKPRHLLGIGEPEDIFEGVSRGIDMFDCVQPTRLARTGVLYTRQGKINLLNEKYIRDYSPLDTEDGQDYEKFSKAYLAHLFRAREMLAGSIASLHNLHFIVSLMKDIRISILEGRFEEFRTSFLATYRSAGT
ncbi:MAG: tRNA guanosine(34) transglycosylase Tgt [Patescibacteria group bacterium]|nr:tRNA guanosine(34) transglycosylase Tgt [Patescibacteria group bacterium]